MAKLYLRNRTLFKVELILNLLAAFFLLISEISCYISPDKFWLFAFFGLAFPLLLFINILFVILWITIKNKLFLISLITILLGFYHITHIYHFSFSKDNNDKDAIKVMSYNVHFFSFYDYKLNDIQHRFKERNNIFSLIKKEAPDIICFQEFFFDKYSGFSTLDTLLKLQDAKFYYASYTGDTSKRMFLTGAATFSRYPIINSGNIPFSSPVSNASIFVDIVKDKDTIRIYNIQLESIKLDKDDEDFYTGGNSNFPVDRNNNKGLMPIFSKFKKAFIRRAIQIRELKQLINDCKYRVMVCGDLNDTPSSYSYHIMNGILHDSFAQSGNGIGTTYNGKFPTFRIDYIWHNRAMTSESFKTLNVDYSDHFPIFANILLHERK